jgi:hypothetical protein
MATEMLLVREGNKLGAAEPTSLDAILAMKHGEVVTATIRRTRNGAHHRKFFALLKVVYDAQDRYATMEHLLDAIKIATGHYEIITITKGREVYKPKSIAFANMGQAAFEQFYDKVVQVVVTKILPNVDRADLEQQVLELLSSCLSA